MNLFKKLSVQVGLLFFLGMVMVSGSFFWLEYSEASERLNLNAESKSISTVSLVAANLSNGVLYQQSFVLWKQMKHIQQSLAYDNQLKIISFAVVNIEKKVLAHSHPRDFPVMKEIILPKQEFTWFGDDLTVVKGVYHPSDARKIGWVLVTFDAHAIQRELPELQKRLVLIFIFALMVSIILATGMSYRVSLPLRKLALLSERVGQGELCIDALEHTPYEIRQLAVAIQQADQAINLKSKALHKSEALLKDVMDHSPAVIFIKDIEGKYILVNARYKQLFHVQKKGVVGLSDADLFDAELAQKLRQHDLMIIESREAMMLEEIIPDDRGDRIYYSLKFPLCDEQGHVYAICGIATDMTDEKEASSEIAKLATVIEQIDDIVMVTDKAGNINYVNPAFERVSGYTAAEVMGHNPSIMKSGQHATVYYEAIWDKIHTGQVWRGEFVNRNKAGECYEVVASITPILDSNGDITGFASTQRDVTQQRKVQKKLQHTDRVESLGVLAGGIAHDFNNLLTAILGNASLAFYKINEDSAVRVHLEAIEKASHSAADLCKQMLAYSGKGKFVIKHINLSELVENMAKLIHVSLAKSMVLQSHLSKDLPAIEGDIAQVQQIVLNLITNASESLENEEGVISMFTGVMCVDDDYLNGCIGDERLEAGDYVYLEVSDTGCGMDLQTQEKVFDPFFTTKFTGRGLGMSAMLGIVKGHQGALRIYSEVGVGTSIKVVFPIAGEQTLQEEQGLTVAEAKTESFSGTVLIVDDEESVRDVASIMLQDLGFQTIIACDGVEGIKCLKQHKHDIVLVLLDMTMPKMDGSVCFQALQAIRKDICVLLSSGYNEQDATNRFTGEGLAGFLQKPYSADQLRDKILSILKS